MTPIATGLIGYGTAGAVFHAPLIAAAIGLRLAGIASSRTDQIAAEFPESRIFARPQDLIADPDIGLVVIATPNDTHASLAREALEAGKHVVVDKPFTLDAAEADALIALAERKGCTLSVFQNRRWDNDFLTVRRLVEDGRLGEVVYYEAHFDRFRPEIKHGWRETPAAGSGLLYDLGAHLIDQALQLFGLPDDVTADVQRQRAAAQTDDYFHIVLRYGHRRAVLHASTLVREPGPRFLVHGDGGSFSKYGIDGQEAALREGRRPGGDQWGLDDPAQFGQFTDIDGTRQTIDTLPGRYTAFYDGVAKALHEGIPPPVLAREARDVIRVIEAAQASSHEGRTMRLV
ncbi:scyllo-inositol 2-dehydrogenase (NADP+) [Luteibacter rhizovicinus]|uniref:Scyllo-inositol 2-dehydrogenase (NADP+) n=1 Tax=Luteibacter rhizovicinus TaxID=242606 RepID=A0A4R3YJ80_9GAMM|nr:oxidoreductase [Luteibacter rhizovicinus]TCV91418.1 scyllo-inositol 2-dehydrogenase (NADP+) [Luteibacter rhizovicinus]